METLPRSVRLALWLAAGPVRADVAAAAVQDADEPHVVLGLGARAAGLADLVRAVIGAGPREVAALLPVPGDLGVPPEVAGLAGDAGECVVALTDDGGWAAVPTVTEFGSPTEAGHLVTWQVHQLPSGRRSLVGAVGTVAEARSDLRTTLTQAVTALDDLDVASWRPEAAAALADLRTPPDLHGLPEGLDQRALGLLIEAVRLLRIAELARADDGGAVNLWQADQRATALREVGRAARRAVGAATLGASLAAR